MENLDYKKAKNCLHGQLFLMSEDELRETGLGMKKIEEKKLHMHSSRVKF